MAHLIKLELKKFGTARNIIFTFAAILFSILILSRLVDTFFSRISLDYAATSKVP